MSQQFDFNGTKFQEELLADLEGFPWVFLDGLETVIEQNYKTHGAFRPHRFLPSLVQSKQNLEGYVIPHGTIISLETLRNPDGSWNANAGIDATGKQAQAVGVAGNIQLDVNSIYGYDRTLDGIVVPTNGTTNPINDLNTSVDVAVKTLRSTGGYVQQADVNTRVALTRRPGNIPMGIMYHQIMRETAGNHMSYRQETAAWSAMRYGILHIPYVIAGATTIATPDKLGSAVPDVGYSSVYWKHQFLLVEDPAIMRTERFLSVDGNGKFILPSAANAANYPFQFGRLLTWTTELFPLLTAEVDGYPGLNVPGTNTGGATRRMFDFVASILTAHGQPAAIKDVTAELKTGKYGMCKVLINTEVA